MKLHAITLIFVHVLLVGSLTAMEQSQPLKKKRIDEPAPLKLEESETVPQINPLAKKVLDKLINAHDENEMINIIQTLSNASSAIKSEVIVHVIVALQQTTKSNGRQAQELAQGILEHNTLQARQKELADKEEKMKQFMEPLKTEFQRTKYLQADFLSDDGSGFKNRNESDEKSSKETKIQEEYDKLMAKYKKKSKKAKALEKEVAELTSKVAAITEEKEKIERSNAALKGHDRRREILKKEIEQLKLEKEQLQARVSELETIDQEDAAEKQELMDRISQLEEQLAAESYDAASNDHEIVIKIETDD